MKKKKVNPPGNVLSGHKVLHIKHPGKDHSTHQVTVVLQEGSFSLWSSITQKCSDNNVENLYSTFRTLQLDYIKKKFSDIVIPG